MEPVYPALETCFRLDVGWSRRLVAAVSIPMDLTGFGTGLSGFGTGLSGFETGLSGFETGLSGSGTGLSG